MKILIWIGTLILITALNVLLGELIGFRMGSILLYLAWWFITKALIKKWDEHHNSK